MTVASRIKALGLFSTAIFDQVLLSGTNFLVGLILIRFTTDTDYGLYVLVQSALLLLVSAQAAWLSSPMAIIAPSRSAEDRKALVSGVKDSQRLLLRRLVPIALAVPVLGYFTHRFTGLIACVLAMSIVASWTALRREYLRGVLLIYARTTTLLHADFLYVLVLLAGVLWATFYTKAHVVWAIAALAIAAWAGGAGAHRSFGKEPGWTAANGDSSPAWSEIRRLGFWSLLGAVIYWLFGQSYSYILASRLDLKAVTDVNAARLVLMPAFVLTIGMQGLLAPTAAMWNAQVGFARLMRRLLAILALVGALDLIYFAFIWFSRDWLIGHALHKHINDRDELLLLWGAVAIIGLMRDVLQCGLIALGRMKSMAGQGAVSAIVALTLMWFGTTWWGAASVLIGQIAGELVNLGGIVTLLVTHSRRAAARPVGGS